MSHNISNGFIVVACVGLLSACLPRVLAPSDTYISDALEPTTETTTVEPLEFLSQAMDFTAADGEQAYFNVVANRYSTLVSYQWQVATSSHPEIFVDIPSAVYSIYSFVTSAADDGCLYRCIATYGNDTIISEPALLTVLSAAETTTESIQGGE